MENIIKKNKLLWLITVLSGLAITILNVGVAHNIGMVIDMISIGDMNKLLHIGIYSLILMASYLLFGYLYSYISSRFEYKVLTDAKSSVIKNLLKAPIYKYQEKEVSYYYNMLTQDIDQINQNYIKLSYENIVLLGGVLASLLALFFINIFMSLIFIGIMFIVMVVPKIFVGMQTKAASNFSDNYEKYVGELENALSGFESIKLLNIGKALLNKLINSDSSMEEARKKKEFVNGVSLYSITGAAFFSQIACMFVGAIFAIKGYITTGNLIMAVQLLNFVFQPINKISANRNLMKSNKVIRDKLGPYLDNQEDVGEDFKKGNIELKDFSLKLGDKKVLNDFNYIFESGKSYAIIGPSGCGKSSLAKSLAGYFEKYDGDINYGGVRLEDLKISELTENIRYIGANVFVLNENIKENIRMYRDISEEDIIKVAEQVGFDKQFIEKESLGHSGKYISSGEYQRIAIARALLDKPYTLILDEPTANLDPINTKSIQNLIKTIHLPIKIVITHDYDDEYLNSFDEVLDFSKILEK